MTGTKQRNANLDLLRIVSMVLIVFLHTIDHSGVLENAENCSMGMYFYVRFTYGLCMVCVNLFVMLSGYFLVTSRFRLQKLAALWMQTAFYAFTLKLIFMLTGQDAFSIVSLVSCFFPFLTGRYWFLTIYVGLYLLFPFLNILIRAMDRRQHGLLNLCLFGLFSLWSSLHPSLAGMNSGGGWGLAWFVVLYLAAAWLRLYYTPDHRPGKWFCVYFAVPALIALGQCLPGDLLGGLPRSILNHWFRYNSAPVYVMTLCLFAGFLNIRIPEGRIARGITSVAPLTLGVYLIHAHANVDPWLWQVLRLPEKMHGAFPLIQIACVAGIFLICIGLDALRKGSVGRLENARWLTETAEAVSACAGRLFSEK